MGPRVGRAVPHAPPRLLAQPSPARQSIVAKSPLSWPESPGPPLRRVFYGTAAPG